MSVIKKSKTDKQLAVSRAILEVIEKDGFLGVTHSKVSRLSKVSRAWIYEYIGKEKSSLVEFAAEVFAENISRINLTNLPKNKLELSHQLNEAINYLFDLSEQNPVVIKLYFRFRGTQNPIGQVIQKYEMQWLKSATKVTVKVLQVSSSQAQSIAELVLTLRLGFAHRIVTSLNPSQTREQSQMLFSSIHSMIDVWDAKSSPEKSKN